MKVVILAGGVGTRICEDSSLRPKPMIEIGGQPILWHIMKIYSYYGYNDFIICVGYKQHMIKEYFADYYLHRSDITFDFRNEGNLVVHNNVSEPWKVTIIYTGINTMTGGRIKRIEPYVNDEDFFLTYGDSVSNIPINRLLDFHREQNKTLTVSVVNPGEHFGTIELNERGMVTSVKEKLEEKTDWVNGGFMVASSKLFQYIEGDDIFLEKETLGILTEMKEVAGYLHQGFWQRIDTQRDKQKLERLWNSGHAPWKVW